jgi:hypothetical protein
MSMTNPLLGFVSDEHELPTDEKDNLERNAKKVKEHVHMDVDNTQKGLGDSIMSVAGGKEGSGSQPAPGLKTYKQTVTGSAIKETAILDSSDDEIWDDDQADMEESIKIEEMKVAGYDCPNFHLSKKEENRIQKPWKGGIIVKMLGRRIGYKALENRLKQMWVRAGIITIVDLGNDYFLVTLSSKEDQQRALSNGPWLIYDHYLTVRGWSPNFNPHINHLTKVNVWVRFSGLPIEYYDAKLLTSIGNRIGRTIKVDKNTLQQERGKYARLCVEVDLSQPLLAMFSIKDRTYKVEYEGLHLLCLGCGKFGHYVEGCPTKDINPKDTRMSAGVDTREEGKCEKQSAQEAGPWTVVSKPRRQRRAAKTGEENKGMESMGSRFAILGKNQTDKEGEELTETNKEMTPVSIDNGLHKEIVLPKGNHPRKDMNHATRRNTNNKKGNTGMQNQDNDKDVAGKNARENKLATRGTKNFKGKNNQGPKIGAKNFTDWMVSATMKAMTETNGMIATSVPLEKTGGAHYEPSGVVNNMGLSETSHIEQDKLPLPNMARPPDATDTSPILSHDQNKINVEGEAFEDATDQGYESVDSGEMEIVRETPSLPQ